MKLLDRYNFKNKSFLLGFIISLLGSLPMGYLNVIGLQILLEQGNLAIISFILGILSVEFFVLKIVSFGAKWLVEQKKLLLFIDVFTILFLSSIAWYFTSNMSNEVNFGLSQLQLAQYPFVLGVLLNGLNAIQWPYWSGIYIYLFRSEKLKATEKANHIFIIGALLGTFLGMLTFVHTSKYVLDENEIQMTPYLNPIFAVLFFILAIIQTVKLFVNRNKKVNQIL
jgi:threonine/homoserine/homoserine lactone efflux protein